VSDYILEDRGSIPAKASICESEAHEVYTHRVTTLINPRGVTTVSHKYGLTVARYSTVLVAVPFTVHCPANYKIKLYYLR
jgi:hypothetical protein